MFFFATAQNAVMPYPHETLGQYMQGKPSDELFIAQCQGCFFTSVAILLHSEAHVFVEAFNPVVGDGYFVGVSPQVFNNLRRSIKRLFAIDHPVFGK